MKLFNYFERHRGLLWALLVALVLLCAVGAAGLRTDENVSAFLPHNADNERIQYAFAHLEADNQIVLSLRCADTLNCHDVALLQQAVDVLVEHLLRIDTALLSGVRYMVDQQQMQQVADFVLRSMPYLLTEADYLRADSLLTPAAIEAKVQAARNMLASPAGAIAKHTLLADPLGLASPLLRGLQGFSIGTHYQLIDDYIFNAEGDEATVLVRSAFPSSETGRNARLLAQVRAAIDSTQAQLDGAVRVSLFGAADIAIANASRIKRDSAVSIAIALVLIALVLVRFYRSAKSIGLLVLALLFGGLFAVGVLGLTGSTVSLLVIGVGSVIIGIAANYPLHFLAHIRQGSSCRQSLADVASPLLTGNITTVGAFLSLLFISSGAMRDLGLFASLLLAGTIVFVLVFLPHFYAKHTGGGDSDRRELSFAGLAGLRPENSPWFIAAMAIATVVLWFYSGRTSFDTNMHNINYMTAEQRRQVEAFAQLVDGNQQMLYCAAEGDSLDEALRRMERVQGALDSVAALFGVTRRAGLGVYLPSAHEQERRLALWASFWKERGPRTMQLLSDAAQRAGFRPDAFDRFGQLVSAPHHVVGLDHFEPLLDALGRSYIIEGQGRAMALSMLYVEPTRAQMLEGVINGIEPHLFAFSSGSITQKLVGALSDDFDRVLYICGIIVFAFLTISFGRIELGLMAFLPLALGWVWILGIMGLTGLQFNIVNIILATFIFGQGDDYAIFVAEGLLYEYAYGKKMLKSYKSTILLSAIIMFVGIGSLVFAQHPAMRSLGQVTVVGMACVVLMAYVVPPLVFRWLTHVGGQKRRTPVTLRNLLKTALAFLVFLLGSVVLTVAGFVLLTIGRPTDRHKLMYHRLICATMRLLTRAAFGVRMCVHNIDKEQFERPSVIVCNHQSHLDLLYTLMLSPKIICLTNQWVWNCPFYGWIIRYADFLPVADGIEASIDRLRPLVQRGYSVLVFPEGTRSPDCSILRFHQGAFYLAQQLGLDVLPVLTHGIGHVFPKNEFVLHPGRVDVRMLPRISQAELPAEPRLAAKQLRQLYLREYAALAQQVETTDYFYKSLCDSYLYKGRCVAARARRALREHSGFAQQVAALPSSGTVRMERCGQGELPLMAALVRKDLQIVASDPDPLMLALAQNCSLRPPNLSFELEGDAPVDDVND
ncbi:MAG: 1-acyl-sn-glycerol-3-phosphate acyltransferase [Bacteroidales bacterium]|nr:1-acyl-sn-glycerol-3-phosphate acyltransferase [Bacteroidales bacterium]